MKKIVIFILLFLSLSAQGDEYRPAYLEFNQTQGDEFKMLWKVPAKGKSQRLSLYVSLPDEVIQTSEPIAAFIGGAYIERSTISHQGGLADVEIVIKGLQRASTDVLVRIQRLDGSSETARLNAASPSFIVKAKPYLWEVINTYLIFGIEHILTGFDHLLFVACLIFIAGTWQRILITISGFTLAHSITLTLAGLELIQLPIAPIEATIALSIVFLAREIALDRRDTLTWRYPVAISSTFGLLHGFGFASALSEMGLPQTEIPAALLAFNIGVEIGQVLFVVSTLSIFWLISRSLKIIDYIDWLKKLEKPIAYGIGSITMFWVIERVSGGWI